MLRKHCETIQSLGIKELSENNIKMDVTVANASL